MFWYVRDIQYEALTYDGSVSWKFINVEAVGKQAFSFHVTTKLSLQKRNNQEESRFFLFPFLLQNISVKAFRGKRERERERLFMIFSILWNKARSLLRVEQIMFSKKKFLSEKQEASVTYKTCWIRLQLNSGSVRCRLNNLEHRSKEKVITEGVWLYVQY